MGTMMLALAGATMLAPPASTYAANSAAAMFEDTARAFQIADMNNDNQVSRAEYAMLRANTINDYSVPAYRGDMHASHGGWIDRSYAQLDDDRNGILSLTEFANGVVKTHPAATTYANANYRYDPMTMNRMAWSPDYVTVSYYLMTNPIDTDTLEGRQVVNLKGDEVGRIDRIIRSEDNRYYAMLDLEGGLPYAATNNFARDRAGVPLEDLLFYSDGHSLLLSTRGEEYLRETDARALEDFEPVDTLYAA